MWTSTLDLDPKRILLTRLLGQFWTGAYFSSFSPLRVQNVPREALAASNWVRVRNRLAGICGSDLHLVYADGDLRVAPAALPGRHPRYLGHEVVGEVIEIGDDVQHLRVGDRVALQYGPNCLSSGARPLCHFCASGLYNLCERGELPAPSPIGGGWSEEMLLPEQQLFRVPQRLSDEQAVMLEPTAVALHAVLRRLPQPGEHVLVIGAGTIGLLTVAVLRAIAPQTKVSVMARYPFQIEQATRLGVEHIIYPQDGYQGVQQVTQAEFYRGWLGNQMLLGGFDVIYDTIGRRKTLHDALRWARAGASVVLVGVNLHMMRIDLTPIWYQEINVLGSLSHGIENWPPDTTMRRSTFSIAAELIESNQIRPELLITHRFALTNYRHALTTAIGKSQSRAIKILFDYALLPASVVPNVRASARPRRPASSNFPLPPAEIEHPAEAEQLSPVRQWDISLPVTPIPSTPQPFFAPDDSDVIEEDDTSPMPVVKKTPPPLPVQEPEPESIPEPAIPASEPVFFPAVRPVPAASDSLIEEIEAMTEIIRRQEELEAAAQVNKLPSRSDETVAPLDEPSNDAPSDQEAISEPTDAAPDEPLLQQETGDIVTDLHASETPLQEETTEAVTNEILLPTADTSQADNIETNKSNDEISVEAASKQEVSRPEDVVEQSTAEDEPPAPPNGKTRQTTRRKRATKETSDALLSVEAPAQRKRTRSQTRKKVEE